MNKHAMNAMYGVLDYVVYPAALLISAPLVLRELGAERYGIWMMANSVTMTGGVIASGLGDANIRLVAEKRAAGDDFGAIRTVENTLGIHIFSGVVISGAIWALCPWMAARAAAGIYADSLWSLRLACVLVLMRAIETVWVSTLRAVSLYGSAFRLSAICRISSVLAAVAIPVWTHSVVGILAVAMLIYAGGLLAQMRRVKRLLNVKKLSPRFERCLAAPLLAFGLYTCIQSITGILFTQLDRVVVGLMFGAAEVTAYAICAQLTQPIYGIAAAGLHFLFPYIASRKTDRPAQRDVSRAIVANVLFVGSATGLLLLCGRVILSYIGPQIAAAGDGNLFIAMVCASALSAMTVTGSYAMLALGRARELAVLTITACLVAAGSLPLFTRLFNVSGVAYARVLCGAISLLIYVPLSVHLARNSVPASRAVPSWEDA